jgi:DNA-directed RNA polymerase subunit RPC12/RpoP
MLYVCYHCGVYRADKIIDPEGPFAICPECGYKHPFRLLPLFVVSGASGAGKSAVLQRLTGKINSVIVLESDIIWRTEFNHPEDGYHNFFESWLRIAFNIGQAGKPVVIFGAGFGVPANLEYLVERRYFSDIKYLALVCDEPELKNRLLMRPKWRGNTKNFIQRQIAYNEWLKEVGSKGHPPVNIIDTSNSSLERTVDQVRQWIQKNDGG